MRPMRWMWIYAAIVLSAMTLTHVCNQTVTVMVEGASFRRSACYIIDAGHGGIDTGATSCSGVAESHTNLQISFRIRDLLHFLGYETKMIRTTDTSIYTYGNTIAEQKVSDLKNRVSVVNETENGVLVSIHQNTFPDKRYRGAQIFYANESSKALALQLQKTLSGLLQPDSNRNIKKASGIYLMEKINRPGILVECGFISNPEDDALLQNEDYQKLLSAIIATTLIKTPSA